MILVLLALLQTPAAWTLQSRVHSKDFTAVRTAPAVSVPGFGTHQCCDKGTLTGGPTTDAFTATVFWQVQFDTGASGWVRQPYLVLDSLAGAPAPPPPAPPPTPPPAPPPPPAGPTVAMMVWLTPTTISSDSGTGPYTVAAIPQDSAFHRLLTTVTWTSSDTAVAKVFEGPAPTLSELARVYLRKPGITTITATSQGKSGSTTFTVLRPLPLPAPVQLFVVQARVTNVPSRYLVQLPRLLPVFSGSLPLWTGVYQLDLMPGADTTLVVGHARCMVSGP